MTDLVVLVITMVTLGQIVYCLPLLLMRSSYATTYLPLAVFFFAQGLIALGPAVFSLVPQWSTHYIAMIFPAWLVLAPSLWLYIEGLTSDTPWRLRSRYLLQFLPFCFGLIVTTLILSTSIETRQLIFSEDSNIESGFPLVVVLSMLMAMILWLLQSVYYLKKIIVRLSNYRKQLKDLFASNEHRELSWLSWVLLIIFVAWTLAFANLLLTLSDNASLFGLRFGSMLTLVLMWTLSYWGLRQKPGFEGGYIDDETEIISPEPAGSKTTDKYQRSALTKEQAQQIKEKINMAMEHEKLYLDSTITLHKLAKQLAILPNYISQTLNETMGANFFDYINRWRIEAAKPKIIANEDTVLNVAMEVGFNARSSFYKAFKTVTGETPTEFRKSNQVLPPGLTAGKE